MMSICLGMLLLLFMFIGYAMTLSNYEYVVVSGIIVCGFCLLAFITEFILWVIFHRNDKGE